MQPTSNNHINIYSNQILISNAEFFLKKCFYSYNKFQIYVKYSDFQGEGFLNDLKA